MKIIHKIEIDSSASVVWKVTADVERWYEWTPTVESIKVLGGVEFGLGSEALIKQPGMPEAKWKVTGFESEHLFCWETKVYGMRIIATHYIESKDAGVVNTLRLDVSGFTAILLWPVIRYSMLKALQKENLGLRSKCELLSKNP